MTGCAAFAIPCCKAFSPTDVMGQAAMTTHSEGTMKMSVNSMNDYTTLCGQLKNIPDNVTS